MTSPLKGRGKAHGRVGEWQRYKALKGRINSSRGRDRLCWGMFNFGNKFKYGHNLTGSGTILVVL